MSIETIANRLVELCRTGQHEQAYHELFADNASAHEMPGYPQNEITIGKEAILKKGEAWSKDVAEVLKMEVTDPLIYGNHFAIGMGIQLKKKDGTIGAFEQEICVYEIQDGKIVSERFIYSMPEGM